MKLIWGIFIVAFLSGCATGPTASTSSKSSAEIEEAEGEKGTGPVSGGDAFDQAAQAPGSSKVAVPDLYRKFKEARRTHQMKLAYDAAVEIFARNPNDTTVLNSLAVMAIEQGKLDLARLLLGKVFAKEPNNPAAINNLGVIELKSDNLRLALVQFKRALEVGKNIKAAHANLGAIYLQYRNYQNAVGELQAAVDAGDQSPETLCNLGYAYKGVGDYSKAESYYEKAIEKDQNNEVITLNYAALLIEHLNNSKKALKFLNKIRFVAREPAILERANALAREAESGSKTGSEKGEYD